MSTPIPKPQIFIALCGVQGSGNSHLTVFSFPAQFFSYRAVYHVSLSKVTTWATQSPDGESLYFCFEWELGESVCKCSSAIYGITTKKVRTNLENAEMRQGVNVHVPDCRKVRNCFKYFVVKNPGLSKCGKFRKHQFFCNDAKKYIFYAGKCECQHWMDHVFSFTRANTLAYWLVFFILLRKCSEECEKLRNVPNIVKGPKSAKFCERSVHPRWRSFRVDAVLPMRFNFPPHRILSTRCLSR